MKTFVDRSRDIQGPDSPDWLCILVSSKLISFEVFSISVCLVNAIENKYDYKLVILNVNCVCCVLHRSVRRCHGRVCGES